MNKPRLFVFGDSWATNYFSKNENSTIRNTPNFGNKQIQRFVSKYNYWGHWLDHMTHFYDVYSYAEGGSCNEQIIYQLGNLPKYKLGDRVIIVFSVPERFTWYINGKRTNMTYNNPKSLLKYKNNSLLYKLFIDQMEDRRLEWEDNTISDNQKKFISTLPIFLNDRNPIITSWFKPTSDAVPCIDHLPLDSRFTSISDESDGTCDDGHLGIFGNYEMFKYLSKKLNLDISKYHFEINKFSNPII